MSSTKRHVLVLGAGISGLSSALRIQELCGDDVDVTVMAEAFSPNTTSDGSGGFWEPFIVGDTDPAVISEFSKETYDHLYKLAASPMASDVKVQLLSGYQFDLKERMPDLRFKDVVFGYRRLTPEEVSMWPAAKDGLFFVSASVQVTTYLNWLTDKIKCNGGRFIHRKLHSFQELSPHWDVVVNCLSLGSYEVLQDKEMFPVRGQVFRIHAPWIKHFFILDDPESFTYILPNVDYTVVGGTCQANDWNDSVSEDDTKSIWARANRLFPFLKGAKILSQWAGLRPSRKSLRLESEVMELGDDKRKLKVVHNYGHGGAGVTLHWGCARKTAEMVTHFLQTPGSSFRDEEEKKAWKSKL